MAWLLSLPGFKTGQNSDQLPPLIVAVGDDDHHDQMAAVAEGGSAADQNSVQS